MAAALKVYIPPIFPDDVDVQLMNCVEELEVQLTSLHRANVAVLPSLQLLDQCETLTDTFLLELARYSLGENRAGSGRAVTVDWLFNSVYAKRSLPFDAYEVKLEVVEGHMGAKAEGHWIVGGLCSAVPDEAARLAAARASRPSSTGDKDAFDGYCESLAPTLPTPSNSAADLVSRHHGSHAPENLSTASSPLSSPPSSPLSEINAIGLPLSIKSTSLLEPAVPTRSASYAAPHRPRGHTYPGETKGYRDRSQIRQVDKAPLDTLICLLRARLAEDRRPVKSWKMLFRDLDRKEPHPRGLQWRTTYQAYRRQIHEAVPQITEVVTNGEGARARSRYQ